MRLPKRISHKRVILNNGKKKKTKPYKISRMAEINTQLSITLNVNGLNSLICKHSLIDWTKKCVSYICWLQKNTLCHQISTLELKNGNLSQANGPTNKHTTKWEKIKTTTSYLLMEQSTKRALLFYTCMPWKLGNFIK